MSCEIEASVQQLCVKEAKRLRAVVYCIVLYQDSHLR